MLDQISENRNKERFVAEKEFVTPQELALILKVPVSWIYQRTRLGPVAIPFVKIGKYIRFKPEEVVKFFENNKRTTKLSNDQFEEMVYYD